MKQKAIVTADFGKSYIVKDLKGRVFRAEARGKGVHYACADAVAITVLNQEQAVIEDHYPRRNVLYREDSRHTKILVTNIEQMLFIAAPMPELNEDLLGRALLAAEYAGIHPIIVCNKADLPATQNLRPKLNFYASLGYFVLYIAARIDVAPLLPVLAGKTSLLVGQSGVGKSTIVNGLVGEEVARVNGLSLALSRGQHTTTHTILYDLPKSGHIIDSPGLQKFSLNYLNKNNITQFFPEFRAYQGQCRFHNCAHQEEPGCKLKALVKEGKASPARLLLLQEILRQNNRGRKNY